MTEREASSGIRLPSGGDISQDAVHLFHGSSIYGAAFNLANAALGAGVLLFPSVYASLGLIPAVLCYLFVTGMMIFALHVLACGAQCTQQISYQAVMRDLISEKVTLLIQISMTLYLLGSCISFLVVVVDMCDALIGSSGSFMQRFWLATLTCILISPLMMLKDISKLEVGSFLGVFVNVFAAIVIAVESSAVILRDGMHPDFTLWKPSISIGEIGSAMSTYTFSNEMALVFIPVYFAICY